MLGLLNTDGVTLVPICTSPTNRGLCVDDGTTGSDLGPDDAKRDENFRPSLMAVSSVDLKTPVALYTDNTNKLLIQST